VVESRRSKLVPYGLLSSSFHMMAGLRAAQSRRHGESDRQRCCAWVQARNGRRVGSKTEKLDDSGPLVPGVAGLGLRRAQVRATSCDDGLMRRWDDGASRRGVRGGGCRHSPRAEQRRGGRDAEARDDDVMGLCRWKQRGRVVLGWDAGVAYVAGWSRCRRPPPWWRSLVAPHWTGCAVGGRAV